MAESMAEELARLRAENEKMKRLAGLVGPKIRPDAALRRAKREFVQTHTTQADLDLALACKIQDMREENAKLRKKARKRKK